MNTLPSYFPTPRFNHFLLILLLSGLASCQKSASPPLATGSTQTSPPPVTPKLGIASISPLSGSYDTTVTIKGTEFSATIANDSVTFNGVTATIISATDTVLIAKVPARAGTGPVKVTVNGQSVSGPPFTFYYTYTVSTIAGLPGNFGYQDGTGYYAWFYGPNGIAVDSAGDLYVTDGYNAVIRKITPPNVVSTLAGVPTKSGFLDGPALTAQFSNPMGIRLDTKGNLYIADGGNNRVREISTAGTVTTVAGYGNLTTGDGPISSAELMGPIDVAVNPQGEIIYCDFMSNKIRKISNGQVTTIAGNGNLGFQDGPASSAEFSNPQGIAIDTAGNIYVSDVGNYRIRKISGGMVTTYAGNGSTGVSDGLALQAKIRYPEGICVDTQGNVYIADDGAVRMIHSGTVTTIAGAPGQTGTWDGPGLTARFGVPFYGICVDKLGNLYVADTQNNAIRKITVQ